MHCSPSWEKNPHIQYSLHDKLIPSAENNQPVRDLGLYFTSDLKWHFHIENIVIKARKTSYAILKSIKHSDASILVNLFKTYIRPTLEFGTNIFNPFLIKDINAIEQIQKHFLKIIYNAQIFEHTNFTNTPPYNELKLKHRASVPLLL